MKLLEKWLKYQGISNKSEFARKAGMKSQTFNDVLKAKHNKDETVKRLADALGVSVEEYRQGPPEKLVDKESGSMTDGERMLEIWKNLPNLPHESLVNIYNAVVSLSRLEESKKNIS